MKSTNLWCARKKRSQISVALMKRKQFNMCKERELMVYVGSQKISQNLFVKSIDVNYAPVRLFFLL
jgi:HKD family nuclease